MNLGRYSKTVAAVVAYLLAWAAQVVASAPKAITSAEWLALAGGLAVALGVYSVTNTPDSLPIAGELKTFDTGPLVMSIVKGLEDRLKNSSYATAVQVANAPAAATLTTSTVPIPPPTEGAPGA